MKAPVTSYHPGTAKVQAGRGRKATHHRTADAGRLGAGGRTRLSREARISLSSQDVALARSALVSGELKRAHMLIRRLLADQGPGRLPKCVRVLIDTYIQAENAALVASKRLSAARVR